MAKSVANRVLDAALNEIVNNCDLMILCSAEPTDLTEATATFALAEVAIDPNDFLVADGEASGRKVTVGAQTDVTVDTTGTGNHIALVDSGTGLLYVTTCSAQAVGAGGTVDLGAWDIEIADPT